MCMNMDFPFEPYPEQVEMFESLTRDLGAKKNTLSLVQFNTGGGKTLTAISATKSLPNQVVYATRTFAEITNVVSQLKIIKNPPQSAMILAARSKICAIEQVRDSGNCIELCLQKVQLGTCEYYNNLLKVENLQPRIYDIEDLVEERICPYYAAKKFCLSQKYIICPYNFLLDSSLHVLDFIDTDSIIIFDEAHNLANASCECLSAGFEKNQLDVCKAELGRLISILKEKDGVQSVAVQFLFQLSLILNELLKLKNEEDETIFSLEDEVLRIYKTRAYNFEALKDSNSLLMQIQQECGLVNQNVSSLVEFVKLSVIIKENLSALRQKFSLTLDFPFTRFEKSDKLILAAQRSVLRLNCLDPSLCLKKVFQTFKKIIFMSGTLAPFDYTLKALKIAEILQENQFQVTRFEQHKHKDYRLFWCRSGLNKEDICLSYQSRNEPSTIQSLGLFLQKVSMATCDGILLFFPSFAFLEQFVEYTQELSVNYLNNRLIYFESSDINVSNHAMNCHKVACELGRGSIFCAVARGRYAEGINIGSIYGRICIIVGVPFIYKSALVRSQIAFYKTLDISENDFIIHDATRITEEAIGRICRQSKDYGCIIFLENRFKEIIQALSDEMKEQGSRVNNGSSILSELEEFLFEHVSK